MGISETIQSESKNKIILIKKDAIKVGRPDEDLIISKKHKILFNGEMVECGEIKGVKDIEEIDYNKERLYNILLERNDYIIVNNLFAESLHHSNPMSYILKNKYYNNKAIKK